MSEETIVYNQLCEECGQGVVLQTGHIITMRVDENRVHMVPECKTCGSGAPDAFEKQFRASAFRAGQAMAHIREQTALNCILGQSSQH